MIERVIRLEGQFGREFEPYRMCDLGAQEGRCALEGGQQRVNVRTAQARDERGCVFEVRANPHFRHSDELARKLRVMNLAAAEHPGEDVADFLRHAQLPLAGCPRRLPGQAGTISTS